MSRPGAPIRTKIPMMSLPEPRGRSPLANRRLPPRAIASLLAWTLAPMMTFTGSARALEPPPRPATPSAERTGSDVRLTWAASAGATRYEVYRGWKRIGVTEGSSFVDGKAPPARASYFVTACRSWACSPGSRDVTVPATSAVARRLPTRSAMRSALGACRIDRTVLALERAELRLEVGELLARIDWLLGGAEEARNKPRPVRKADTFGCLDTATDVVTVDGSYTDKYTADGSRGRAWDARGFDTVTDNIRHGAVVMRKGSGAPGACWAGGHVRSTRALNASWIEHKATEDPADPSRNTAAISNASVSGTVTGLHAVNVGDAFRNYETQDWLVQHSWAEYVRDDGIENDDLRRGRVHDVLLDGVYSGFSARPSRADDEAAADGNVVTLDRVLLRMEAQPYPYKWKKKGGNINARGEPWRPGDGIPYGHGNIFKIEHDDVPGRNVRWALRDVTIMATHRAGDPRKLNFPPEELIEECSGVSVIWTGGGDYPGTLPDEKFPDCVSVVTGEEGHALWAERVADWHARHPEVGASRKPEVPGRIEWPRSSASIER